MMRLTQARPILLRLHNFILEARLRQFSTYVTFCKITVESSAFLRAGANFGAGNLTDGSGHHRGVLAMMVVPVICSFIARAEPIGAEWKNWTASS